MTKMRPKLVRDTVAAMVLLIVETLLVFPLHELASLLKWDGSHIPSVVAYTIVGVAFYFITGTLLGLVGYRVFHRINQENISIKVFFPLLSAWAIGFAVLWIGDFTNIPSKWLNRLIPREHLFDVEYWGWDLIRRINIVILDRTAHILVGIMTVGFITTVLLLHKRKRSKSAAGHN